MPFSKLFDFPQLQPELSTRDILAGLELARHSDVACAVVRPSDIEVAVRTLQGSSVAAGCIVGFPHGWQSTAVKLYEARDLLRRGARELDFTAPLPKLLSREFQHVQTELLQAAELCRNEGAILKVTIPGEHLTVELKIVACRCCERAEAQFVTASTLDDARLFRKQVDESVAIAVTGVTTLDEALEAQAVGVARIASRDAATIINAWKARESTQTT